MKSNSITNKEYWREYWQNYWKKLSNDEKIITQDIKFKDLFDNIVINLPSVEEVTSLEVGGFPGRFSLFLKKYYNVDPTIVDYYINKDIFQDFCAANGFSGNCIKNIDPEFK